MHSRNTEIRDSYFYRYCSHIHLNIDNNIQPYLSSCEKKRSTLISRCTCTRNVSTSKWWSQKKAPVKVGTRLSVYLLVECLNHVIDNERCASILLSRTKNVCCEFYSILEFCHLWEVEHVTVKSIVQAVRNTATWLCILKPHKKNLHSLHIIKTGMLKWR